MIEPAYIYSRRLYHHETDGDGVCHFSNYFRIAEEAMLEFLREKGIPMDQTEYSLAVVSAHSDYTAPLRFAELFKVTLDIANMRRSWCEFTATITGNGDEPRARLLLKIAAVSRETGDSMPLSPKIRALSANH